MSLRSQIVDEIWRILKGIVRLGEIFQEHWFDIRYGTDTAGEIQLCDLKIDSDNISEGNWYQATKERPFKNLMEIFSFPENSVFVDLGSGKGKVLLMASAYAFKRVVGIEFASELCEIAKINISQFKKKIISEVNIEIIEADVAQYEIKDDENIFYIANFFDSTVMDKVLKNIEVSLQKKPRKLWLIYHNPLCREVVDANVHFEECFEGILNLFGDPCVVYVSDE